MLRHESGFWHFSDLAIVVGNVPPLWQSRHRDRTTLAAYQSRDRFCDLVIPISSVGLAWRDKRQAGKSAEKRDLATRSF